MPEKKKPKLSSNPKPDDKAMLELLLRCRPFVWRAMQGGKAPHAQDKEDAKQLWPLIKDLKQ